MAPNVQDLKNLGNEALKWWGKNKETFPVLFIVSSFVLAIPATSAPSERMNSIAKLITNDRRANLAPETIEALMLLRMDKELQNSHFNAKDKH